MPNTEAIVGGGVLVEATEEDEQLGDEAGRERQSEGRERREDHHRSGERHGVREAGELIDVAGVGVVVDDADHDEEQARDQAVGEHLQCGAVHAHLAKRRNPEQHVAHVAHAGVGDEALEVFLAQREHRAVEDADRGESCEPDAVLVRLVRHQRHADAQHAVATHLQQDASEDDRDGRRRVRVRIGEPGVQREHRQLHGEGNEDEPEDHPDRQDRAANR